jgi:hypothetical protein
MRLAVVPLAPLFCTGCSTIEQDEPAGTDAGGAGLRWLFSFHVAPRTRDDLVLASGSDAGTE